jgi:hypothetical protein
MVPRRRRVWRTASAMPTPASTPLHQLQQCEEVIATGNKALQHTASAIKSIISGKLYLSAGYPSAQAYFEANRQSVQSLFFQRALAEFQANNITATICLLKASIGSRWFKPVLQYPHCLLHQRLAFHNVHVDTEDAHSNPHGFVVVYPGSDIPTFSSVFSAVGSIPGVSSWPTTLAGGGSPPGDTVETR